MKINLERLLLDIDSYATYGENDQGGVTRPSFSPADVEVRQLFIEEIKEMGLEVIIDGAANIWGKYKGTGKKRGSIVIGSHLDSVPNGGKYDGPLGVLMAKEIVKRLIESNIRLDHDIEIVSFTAEESNDFNLSTFGSRSFVGRLTAEMLQDACDLKGDRLSNELNKVNGGLDKFAMMKNMHSDIQAFIELHIEQGQRLESANIPMAVINSVVGTYRSTVKVIGQSNHSGTTMMQHRKDALTASSEMILAVERYCQSQGDVVGTVGRLTVSPNAANIIPGQIDFILEVRAEKSGTIQRAVEVIQEIWQEIAARREVKIQQEVFLDQKPVVLDHDIVTSLVETARDMNEPCLVLPSMAVHDAAHMASITKSAMVFVKSIDGKSHCPEEYSQPEDIEKAGNLILQGIINLDRTLSKSHFLKSTNLQ
ncbi:Zn-dependent hydrolase [Bacillus sp. MM2020_1]|nr:Zn-dependent hydrolase [Bacillus sp. MM2020_1]